jgi:hypothetical protein
MTLEPSFTLGVSLLGSVINLNSIFFCLDGIVAKLPG